MFGWRRHVLSHVLAFICGCSLPLYLLSLDTCPVQQGSPDADADAGHGHGHLLVLLIVSSPANAPRRRAIRETWLSDGHEQRDVKHYFVVGSRGLPQDVTARLQDEQRLHGDVLSVDVTDTYSGLARKLLAALVWLDGHVTYEYVLKCDDDTFVHVKGVVSSLREMAAAGGGTRLYWGYFNGRAAVKRSGKWAESRWLLCDHYLPYALGGGYVLSRRLVSHIARNADDLVMYNSEDVSVGVWLAGVRDVNRVHDPRFDTEHVSRGCSNSYLVSHKHGEEAMRKLSRNLRSGGRLCEVEYSTRAAYVYDWNVPPSRCCLRSDEKIP